MSIEGLESKLAELKSDNMRAIYIRQSFGMEYEDFIETLEKMKAYGMEYIPNEKCIHTHKNGLCNCDRPATIPDTEMIISKDTIRRTFDNNWEGDDFSGLQKAESWLRENWYSYGSIQGDTPAWVKKGDYIIEKWTEIDAEGKEFLDGWMIAEAGSPGSDTIILHVKIEEEKPTENVDAAG